MSDVRTDEEGFIPQPKGKKRILEGAIYTLLLSAFTTLLGYGIGQLLHPLVGVLLALDFFVSTWLYFFYEGLIEEPIPIGHQAIGLWLENRNKRKIYSEGWAWNWPAPFGGFEVQDMREVTLVIAMKNVLTKDRVPVEVNASVQVLVVNIYTFKSIVDAFDAATRAGQAVVREEVAKEDSDSVNELKARLAGDIEVSLRGGQLNPSSIRLWGIEIVKARVEDIKRPPELDSAATGIKVEKAQRKSERFEIGTVSQLMKDMKRWFPKLSDQAIANVVQGERSKIVRVVIDGTAEGQVKQGALIGGALDNASPNEPKGQGSSPSNSQPQTGTQRRRGRK